MFEDREGLPVAIFVDGERVLIEVRDLLSAIIRHRGLKNDEADLGAECEFLLSRDKPSREDRTQRQHDEPPRHFDATGSEAS